MLVPHIPVEAVNQYAKQLICETDTNLVSLVMMREADGAVYPTEQELADIVKQVRGEKLEAYVDNVKQEPLIAQKPKAGKIKSTAEDKKLGFKTLTLSNGAKVVLKKTDYKDNEIQFAATANVGYAALDKADYTFAFMGGMLLNASGLGQFSSNASRKPSQASRQAWLTPSLLSSMDSQATLLLRTSKPSCSSSTSR